MRISHCQPSCPSRAIKLAPRPIPGAIARVLEILPQAELAGKVTGQTNLTPQHALGYQEFAKACALRQMEQMVRTGEVQRLRRWLDAQVRLVALWQHDLAMKEAGL